MIIIYKCSCWSVFPWQAFPPKSNQHSGFVIFFCKLWMLKVLTTCYKTFFVRNLKIFVISQSVCPWQAFPAQSIVCGQGQEHTLQCSPSKGLQQGRFLIYKQTLDQVGKACLGQTLQLIWPHHQERRKKSFITSTPGRRFLQNLTNVPFRERADTLCRHASKLFLWSSLRLE